MERKDPYLDAGMRGWIASTAKKNYWRVSEWYELEDLVQDGYLCYYKCWNRYKNLTIKRHPSKEDKRRFMALVQVAFNNFITTLAWKCSTGVNERVSEMALSQFGSDTAPASWDKLLPAQEEEATLAVMLANAPSEVAQLMATLSKDVVAYARGVPFKRMRKGLRETTKEHYRRLLNLPEGRDIQSSVVAYFGGEADGLSAWMLGVLQQSYRHLTAEPADAF